MLQVVEVLEIQAVTDKITEVILQRRQTVMVAMAVMV